MTWNADVVNNVGFERLNFESGGYDNQNDPGILKKDIVFSGITGIFKAGEALTRLALVCYDNTTNALIKADLDAAASYPCIGILLETTASGSFGKVLLWGYLRAEDLDFGVRATGTVTINGNVADEEYITINGTTYQFTDDGTVTDPDYIALDISGGVTKAIAQAALTAAVAANDSYVTLSAWDADVTTVTASGYDVAATANAVTLVKSGTNIAVSGATLANGTNGNKLWLGDAGEISKTVSVTGTEYNQLIGQALSMKEALIKPDLYGLVVT